MRAMEDIAPWIQRHFLQLAWAGLDNQIDVRDIVSAAKASKLGSECVRVIYRSGSDTNSFEIAVTKPDRLLGLLPDAQRQARARGSR